MGRWHRASQDVTWDMAHPPRNTRSGSRRCGLFAAPISSRHERHFRAFRVTWLLLRRLQRNRCLEVGQLGNFPISQVFFHLSPGLPTVRAYAHGTQAPNEFRPQVKMPTGVANRRGSRLDYWKAVDIKISTGGVWKGGLTRYLASL